MMVTWDSSDDIQRKAAHLIFKMLRDEGYVLRRKSDQTGIRRFKDVMDQGFTATAVIKSAQKNELSTLPKSRQRRFKRNRKNVDCVVIDMGNGTRQVLIPAVIGTFYWAILRYMYGHINRPISGKELCQGVQEVMQDRNPYKWSRFVAKSPSDWQERLIRNARNLCRLGGIGAYGQRLVECGHVMRCETVAGGIAFHLSTTITPERLAPYKRGRKGTVTRHTADVFP